MITTNEAARRLGVSRRRVNALIESGQLVAQRFGKSWMVDERSVDDRAKATSKPGRRLMNEKEPSNLAQYTLMNRNHAVLNFTYNKRTGETAELEELEGIAYKPFGIGVLDRAPNRYDLAEWIRARAIPNLRPNLAPLLSWQSASQPSDLMLASYGLNLSDQYWFRPQDCGGEDLDWKNLNYFENGYGESPSDLLLTGSPAPAGVVATSFPDSATGGMLAKAWVREGGVDLLLKGGSGVDNREPYNELLATKLLSRILGEGEFVSYDLVERKGRAYSACPTMCTAETELIAAADVLTAFGVTPGRNLYAGYVSALEYLGVPHARNMMAKMIVADYLMANFDRHAHNFGIMRDAESLDGYRVAPLFDNGCGFYARATLGELLHGRYLWESHPFEPYPSQQLALVEDMGWYEAGCLDGFLDEVREVLGMNPRLDDEFIEAVATQTAKQIETVNDLALERSIRYYA